MNGIPQRCATGGGSHDLFCWARVIHEPKSKLACLAFVAGILLSVIAISSVTALDPDSDVSGADGTGPGGITYTATTDSIRIWRVGASGGYEIDGTQTTEYDDLGSSIFTFVIFAMDEDYYPDVQVSEQFEYVGSGINAAAGDAVWKSYSKYTLDTNTTTGPYTITAAKAQKTTPAAPSITTALIDGQLEGTLTGTVTGLEYSEEGADSWTAFGGSATSVEVGPGTYEVRVKETFKNYAGTSTTVYVGPEKPTSANVPTDLVYSGSMQSLKNNLKDYAYTSRIEITEGTTAAMNAGSYTAYATLPAAYPVWSDGDPGTTQVQLDWTIGKRTAVPADFDTSGYSKEYNGKGQGLTTAQFDRIDWGTQSGTNASITVLYNGSDSLPVDVAGYTVSLKISGFTNFADGEITGFSNTFYITQKTPSATDFEVSDSSHEYDGTTKGATVTLKSQDSAATYTGGGTITPQYRLNGNSATPTDCGTYDVYITMTEGTNFKAVTDPMMVGTLTIEQMDPTSVDFVVTYIGGIDQATGSNDGSCGYDGDTKTVSSVSWISTKSNGSVDPTFIYVQDDQEIVGEPKDAGTYDVYAQVASGGTNFKPTAGNGVKVGTLTVSPRTLTDDDVESYISFEWDSGISSGSWTYDATQKGVSTYGWKVNSSSSHNNTMTIQYLKTGESTATTDKPKDEGTYTVFASVASMTGGNYGATSGNGLELGTLTVNKATLAISNPTWSYSNKYDGQEHSVEFTVSGVRGDDVEITVTPTGLDGSSSKDARTGNGTVTFSIEGTDVADSGSWSWKAEAGDNYEVLTSGGDQELVLAIDKAQLEVSDAVWSYEGTYDGAEHTIGFTVSGVRGDDVEITVTPTGLDGSSSKDARTGNGTVTFSIEGTDVADSGSWSWKAEAGDNYEVLTSGGDQELVLAISKAIVSNKYVRITYPGADPDQDGNTAIDFDGQAVEPDVEWISPYVGALPTIVYYQVSEDGTEVPLGDGEEPTTAGTYRAYARFDGDANPNFQPTAGKGEPVGTLTINKIQPDGSAIALTYPDDVQEKIVDGKTVMYCTFDGTDRTPGYAWSYDAEASTDSIAIHYKDLDGNDVEAPLENAGTYIVYADITGDPNYADVRDLEVGTLEIAKKETTSDDVVVEFDGAESTGSGSETERKWTYDGTDRKPRAHWKDGKGDDGSITIVYYEEDGDGGWKTVPMDGTPTAPGRYRVAVVISDDDPNFDAPDPNETDLGTVVIEKKTLDPEELTEDIVIDWGTEDEDEDGNPSYDYDGTGQGPDVSFKEPKTAEKYRIVYYKEGEDGRDEPLGDGEKPTDSGKYKVYIEIEEGDPNFGPTGSPGIQIGTVVVGKGTLEIVDFRYDLVDDGEKMTMTVTIDSAGTLTGNMAVGVGGKTLTLASCTYSADESGMIVAAIVYDTSLGDVPAGILTTVSISYPGDPNHEEMGPHDYQVRTRSADLPVIPDEGGDVPVDPDNGKTDVDTPIGDVEIEIEDDGDGGDDGSGDGSTPVIHVHTKEADPDEKIPGESKTYIIETDGKKTGPDGTEIPVKYRITPTIDVKVPSGKKPVVTLYDVDGNPVEKPKVISYGSDHVTFSTDAEGYSYLKVGISFETVYVIVPDSGSGDGDDVPIIIDPTGKNDGSDGGESSSSSATAVTIAAGCVIALLAILVLAFGSRINRD